MKYISIIRLLLSLLSLTITAQEWVNPANTNVQTVFYQGMFSSQTQGAKYTGTHGFTATTGEHVVNPYGIDVIQNLYVKPEIDEVIPASNRKLSWSDLTLHPKHILGAAYRRMCYLESRYTNYSYGTQIKPVDGQISDQTIAAYSLDISKINIAQEGDIASHRRRFEQCAIEYPESPVIFYGVSRGAATTFQSLAQLSKEGVDISKVKLCILEGCFDDVTHVMRQRHPWILGSELSINVLAGIASKVISFKKDGLAPIKMVNDFPHTIPVAFISSKIDKEVPVQCAKNLVDKLCEAGHKDVYLLELKNSSHPRYMFDDEEDIHIYQNFAHALYKKYGLPYIHEYAEVGKNLIEICKQEKSVDTQDRQ